MNGPVGGLDFENCVVPDHDVPETHTFPYLEFLRVLPPV